MKGIHSFSLRSKLVCCFRLLSASQTDGLSRKDKEAMMSLKIPDTREGLEPKQAAELWDSAANLKQCQAPEFKGNQCNQQVSASTYIRDECGDRVSLFGCLDLKPCPVNLAYRMFVRECLKWLIFTRYQSQYLPLKTTRGQTLTKGGLASELEYFVRASFQCYPFTLEKKRHLASCDQKTLPQ